MSCERDEAKIDRIGFRRLSGWLSRSFAASVADLRLVDCGSLDVLLYCADDLAVNAPGDRTLTGHAEVS